MSSDPQDIYAADAYLQSGNYDAAIETAKTILAREPEDADALCILSNAYLSKGDLTSAGRVARELIAFDPELDAGHRALAVCLLNETKLKPALESARQAVACDSSEAGNHVILALVLDELTKFDDAEQAYREALELEPDHVYAKTSYANFLLSRGRDDEAATLAAEVSQEIPDDIETILLRGRMALRDGDVDEARNNVMWALQQDATDHAALHLLAQIKMRKNPLLGLWWRYAIWMERFTTLQRWLLVIGLYVAWRFLFASVAVVLGPLAILLALAWLVFCVLTWIGPWLLNRMVRRELKSVEIKPF